MMRIFLLIAFCYAGYCPAQIQFQDVAGRAGIGFVLRNGASGAFYQPELMLGGVAALDYDNDGCMDIYFTNGAALPSMRKETPAFYNRLYRNNCDMTFTDVTRKAGLSGVGYSMAAAAADYDNDGFTDLFVAGVNENHLYHNHGDGTFEDVTARAGLSGVDSKYGKIWSISAGWFDADNDGYLDLFVSNYVGWSPQTEILCGTPEHRFYCHPHVYPPRPHQLFRNQGDGRFIDISREAGISGHLGKGMGVAFGDFNGDGLTDVFVANDSMRNFLFENKGGGRFEESGLLRGVGFSEHGRAIASMGADFRDVDEDGRPDLVLTGMANDTYLFFRNYGEPRFFRDWTVRSGLTVITKSLTGWGMGVYDFDNDGHKDLFVANAHFPELGPYLGSRSELRNSILQNLGDARFRDASADAGPDFQMPAFHRGVAFADFDNDGRVDVVVSVVDGPARLFRNVTRSSGHWLALELVGSRSNRNGLGASVRVTLPDGTTLYNHATTSVGYASSSEPLVRFGLGGHRAAKEIVIRWPGGPVQNLLAVEADRVLRVCEPDGGGYVTDGKTNPNSGTSRKRGPCKDNGVRNLKKDKNVHG